MKILVTGARGMLGSDLCDALSAGHDVTGIDIEEADITQCEPTRELIRRFSPGMVFHCAAFTDVDGSEGARAKAFKVNAEGTRNVALGCKDCGSSLVYMSTDYVFDGKSGRPYVEDDPPNPLGAYGASKLEGERFVQSVLSDYRIVRTSWLFGLRGRNFVDTIIRLGQDRDAIEVVDDQVGSPTFSRDLCSGLLRLVASENRGVFHLCNSGSCSWFEFAREIIRTWGGSKAVVVPVKSTKIGRPAPRPSFSVLDSSRFAREFGSELRPWKDALAEYVELRRRQTAGSP
ncbi:MAG: dTDP-4-dehydrorhamnose reductase [Candidatus Eisenbacteria bacterium]